MLLKQKIILLFGATGFIGGNILKAIINSEKSSGYKIRLAVRDIFHVPSEFVSNPHIEVIYADLFNIQSLKEVFQDVTHILHTVQFNGHPVERPWRGKQFTYHGFEGTVINNIIQALQETDSLKNIQQYIYISGAGIEENSKYPWCKAKLYVEEQIKKNNILFTFIRPSWIYGHGDKSVNTIISLAKKLPVFPLIGDGKNIINPVFIDDLAQITVKVIDNPEAINQVYSIGTLGITMYKFYQEILKSLKIKKIILKHPKLFMKFIGLFTQFLPFAPFSMISPGSVDFINMEVQNQEVLKNDIWGVKLRSVEEGLDLLLHES